jgi:site-specific recombinase XerD
MDCYGLLWDSEAAVARLDRVDARKRLAIRREPHWHRLSEGRHLGFRRMTGESPGTWIARAKIGDRYHQKPLGDFAELDPSQKFDAAASLAAQWFRHLDLGGSTEKITVQQACANYVAKLRTERTEAAAKDAEGTYRRSVNSDKIAEVELSKLAPRDIDDWRGRLLKGKRTRAYCNRIMTALRAALNLAHARRDVASDLAWKQGLKALDAPSGRRTLYLDRQQRRDLIDEASDELKPLVTALCLLPLRVGELVQCRVGDFDSAHGVLRVTGKTGSRDIPLSKDAVTFFRECAKGKTPAAYLVSRADGRQMDRFWWRNETKVAAAGAKLPRNTVLYSVRHSVIADLVTGGLDLFTTGQVSGTSVAMIEKHYGKLRAQVARKALAGLSL